MKLINEVRQPSLPPMDYYGAILSLVPATVRYIATDPDGRVFGYDVLPVIMNTGWRLDQPMEGIMVYLAQVDLEGRAWQTTRAKIYAMGSECILQEMPIQLP